MAQFNDEELTKAVINRMQGANDPRLREIMTALVRHLHDFAREVKLSEAEWLAAIDFLTRTGQMCDGKRQEFILLSDTLGLSMLVDALNNKREGRETPSTVLGPFYVPGAPDLPMGADIAANTEGGFKTSVSGRVLNGDGKPIESAVLDVWQTAPNGLYDVQDPQAPEMNLRGRFRTGSDGAYRFWTIKPVSYPVPTDGPVGKMLLALGRHPYRPAHLHFIVTASGFEKLTTHIFVRGDRYLDSDAVFGVKDALMMDFIDDAKSNTAAVACDFVLKRTGQPS
ncbi:MAG: hedE [Alphaproteobacteria bacterium]|jgi:protocatechuate 3,4-dioxygenase beta subunit|nr:hedE [Alphaproteobacteria bacterium]